MPLKQEQVDELVQAITEYTNACVSDSWSDELPPEVTDAAIEAFQLAGFKLHAQLHALSARAVNIPKLDYWSPYRLSTLGYAQHRWASACVRHGMYTRWLAHSQDGPTRERLKGWIKELEEKYPQLKE